MRITRLSLRDLRRYHDLEVDLAPGMTVIRGPNEAGKTTIQRAIELALTRKATATGAELETLRPWDASDDARPEIAIEFVQEDEDGTRTGRLQKSFRGAKGTVRLEYAGQVVTDPALADHVVGELTGIPTEAFFRSTASVRHHELSDLDRDEATLRDRLQASISGADRGTSKARKQLDKALKDLQSKGDKNPGRLKATEDEVNRLQGAVDQGEASLAGLERDRDALSTARERRANAEVSLTERRSLLEKARQAERLVREREVAQERYGRYRQAVEVSEELTGLAASHPSKNPLPVLRPAVERLRSLDTRIRELKAMLAGEIEVAYEVRIPEPLWRPTAILGIVAIFAGVALAAADVLNAVSVPNGRFIGLGVAVAGAGLAYVSRRQRTAALDLRRQKQLRDVEIDRRLRGRSQLEEELKQHEADSARRLAGLGLADLAVAEDLLAKEEAHVAQIERLSAQLEGLAGKDPTETLPRVRDTAALEIEQKTSAIEALGPIAKEPRARERLEVEVAEEERGLERARDDEANARARVEASTVDAEQVAADSEKLVARREQLGALQRRTRVYDTTLKAIERAERATMRTATRYLEKRMVGDIARITSGRYRRVRVDDTTLDIAVHAPEKGDWVDVRALSKGTLDLVYLAARLGLVRLVTGDRRPPLIFDDPLVTFDDERAARAVGVLRDLARDFQVIYLTTSDRYDDVADTVVELPGPTALDDGPDAEGQEESVTATATGAKPAGGRRR